MAKRTRVTQADGRQDFTGVATPYTLKSRKNAAAAFDRPKAPRCSRTPRVRLKITDLAADMPETELGARLFGKWSKNKQDLHVLAKLWNFSARSTRSTAAARCAWRPPQTPKRDELIITATRCCSRRRRCTCRCGTELALLGDKLIGEAYVRLDKLVTNRGKATPMTLNLGRPGKAQRGVLHHGLVRGALARGRGGCREVEAAPRRDAEKSAAALNEGITGELLALFLDLTAEKEAALRPRSRLLALKEEEERAAEQAKQEEIEREANERKQMTAETRSSTAATRPRTAVWAAGAATPATARGSRRGTRARRRTTRPTRRRARRAGTIR